MSTVNYKSLAILVFTFVFPFAIYAQVGINTAAPQNDLHVNGGVRVNDSPRGNQDDASNRIAAFTADGDLVHVTISDVLSSLRIPVLAFNARFGVSTSPEIPFFADCNPCSSGDTRRFNLNDELIVIDTPLVTLVDPSGTDADEYFRINEAGDYRFELNLTPIYEADDVQYRVNVKLHVIKADGTGNQTEVIRLYAGEPSDRDTSFGISGYITDTRNYGVGDQVYMEIAVATVSGGTGEIYSRLVSGGGTYQSQVIITRY